MFAAIWSIDASSGCGAMPGGANVYWSAPCSVATGTFAVAIAGCSVASSVRPCTGLSGVPTWSRKRPSQPVRRCASVWPTS